MYYHLKVKTVPDQCSLICLHRVYTGEGNHQWCHDTHRKRLTTKIYTTTNEGQKGHTRKQFFYSLSSHTHTHSPSLSLSLFVTHVHTHSFVLSNLKLFLVHAGSVHGGRPSDEPWRDSTPKTLLRRRVGQWRVWFG